MRKLALVLLVAAVFVPSSAAAVGDQRVLVLLTTWGPQPWARGDVAAAFAQADALLRRSSFGQLRLHGTVTEWLHGYPALPTCPAPEHERIPPTLTDGPEAAARAAGFDPASYDRIVYILPWLE